MPKSSEKELQRKATVTTNIIGTTCAASIKLGIFQPLDTLTAHAMLGKEKLKQFFVEFKNSPWKEKIRKAYRGSLMEFLKKIPSHARYPIQHSFFEHINHSYKTTLEEHCGSNAPIAAQAMAGGITGMLEPFFLQPFDTLQANQQIFQKSLVETFKKLGVKNLYKGMWVTSLFRNFPTAVVLFGGSEALNKLLGNENKESNILNLAAKTTASFVAITVSQPAEVLKIKLQTTEVKKEVWKTLQLKELCSNGLKLRILGGGIKMGFGFYLAEKGMKIAANLWGEEPTLEEVFSKMKIK